MAKRAAAKGGVYLYGVVRGTEDRKFDVKGLFDSDVFTISHGDLLAVVSEVPSTDKLRPERRHLSAHQRVLTELMKKFSVVLPVSFGTISDSSKSVQDLISRYHKEMVKQINRVEGKVEMGVRVALDVPNVFEFFLTNNAELKQARDEVFADKRVPTREEKIDLGQKFEAILNKDREDATKKVEKVLSRFCTEIKRNKVRNEQEMMRLSCLIEKDKGDQFESAVTKAAENFDDNFVFDYNGPLPPYDFVDVHIRA